MGFFNGDAADAVQHWSLALELVGLALACLEVLFPHVADRVEEFIDDMTNVGPGSGRDSAVFLLPLALACFVAGGHSGFRDVSLFFGAVVGLFAVGLLIQMTVDALFEWEPGPALGLLKIALLVVLCPLLAMMVVAILPFAILNTVWVVLLSGAIDGLNRVSHGRALGTLGLILALLGFLGEVYQILTLYLG